MVDHLLCVFPAFLRVLTRTPDLRTRVAKSLVAHLKAVESRGATICFPGDAIYPPNLAHIADFPLALVCLGNSGNLSRAAISCVGSRRASPRALNASFLTGAGLARLGWQVVSGGAFGCDIAVHRGVLTQNPALATVVFAGGLEALHPSGNSRVFAEILASGGVLVSERMWHAPSLPHDFPVRNRIVSGMSSAVVVLEAAERSGALITARTALDQGRDVWVLDPAPDDIRAAGGLRLVESGAKVFTTADYSCEKSKFGDLCWTPPALLTTVTGKV